MSKTIDTNTVTYSSSAGVLTITNGGNTITVHPADAKKIYELATRSAHGEFVTKTLTGTLTNGTAHVTGLSSTAGIYVGAVIRSSISGLPAGATVTTIDSSSQVSFSGGNFTGTTGSATLNFGVITVGSNSVLVSASGGITLINSTNTITHTLNGWLGTVGVMGCYEISRRSENAEI